MTPRIRSSLKGLAGTTFTSGDSLESAGGSAAAQTPASRQPAIRREYTKPEVRSADHSVEKTRACDPIVTRAGWPFRGMGQVRRRVLPCLQGSSAALRLPVPAKIGVRSDVHGRA